MQHPDEVKASLRLELSQHNTNLQAERYCLRPQTPGLLSLSEEVAGADQILRHISIRPKARAIDFTSQMSTEDRASKKRTQTN